MGGSIVKKRKKKKTLDGIGIKLLLKENSFSKEVKAYRYANIHF